MYVWTALCVAGRHMGRLRKPAREEAPSCSLALPLPSLRAVVWHLWHLWQLCGTDGTNGNCVASQMAMSCRVCVCRDSCVLARALARRPPSFAQSWTSQVLFLATFILPTAPITLFRDKVSSPVVVVLHQTLLWTIKGVGEPDVQDRVTFLKDVSSDITLGSHPRLLITQCDAMLAIDGWECEGWDKFQECAINLQKSKGYVLFPSKHL